MKKVSFVFACLIGQASLFAQNGTRPEKVATTGIIVQQAYQENISATRGTVVDARSGFIFNMVGLDGQSRASLARFNPATEQWISVPEQANVLFIACQSTIRHMQPGNEVSTIYWKDPQDIYWRATTPGSTDNSATPQQLDQIMQAQETSSTNTTANQKQITVLPIQVQYR